MLRRAALTCLYVAVSVVTLAFLAFPIVAIFAHTSPEHLFDQLSNPVVRDAFVVSLKTSVLAQVLILVFGTPTAYLLATNRFPGYSIAITLVELPLVLPVPQMKSRNQLPTWLLPPSRFRRRPAKSPTRLKKSRTARNRR